MRNGGLWLASATILSLCAVTDAQSRLAAGRQTVGSAPEGPGSAQADVYSVGKVLYQASTGMDCHLFPETPTQLMEDAHETGFLDFFEVVAKACANETSRRYNTAAELHADLQKLADRLGLDAR